MNLKEVMPDKPGLFTLVSGSYGRAPEFEILCGLDDHFKAFLHTEKEVRGIVKKYLRTENPHKLFLTPRYRKENFVIPLPLGNGKQKMVDEIIVVCSGRINPLHNPSMTSEVARNTVQKFLTGLGEALGYALGQVRVIILYNGYQWTIQLGSSYDEDQASQ